MAEPSLSAIRSACRAPASPAALRWSSPSPAGGWRWRRCAWVSVRASRWPSNARDGARRRPAMARLLDALVGDAAMQAIFSDREELAAMMRVEAALALAAAEAGLVADAAALETAQACASFEPDRE